MATGNAGYTDVQVRTLSRDLLSITRNSSVIHYGLLRSIDQSLKMVEVQPCRKPGAVLPFPAS
jgi:hypothetical protein